LLGSSEGLIEENISILHFREGMVIVAILQFFLRILQSILLL
jgi:hypothetical protein